jgi:hypothetical protein
MLHFLTASVVIEVTLTDIAYHPDFSLCVMGDLAFYADVLRMPSLSSY